MAKLSDRDKGFLRLIDRSPGEGQGWKKVSATCWPLIETFGAPELIEAKGGHAIGGFVRLTDKGEIVAEYLI